MADALDVDAPRRDVGGDEDAARAVAKGAERPLALRLGLVAVDRGRRDALVLQVAHHLVGAVLGAGEHQHALDLRIAQKRREEGRLAGGGDVKDALLDPLHGGGDRRHRHLDRIAQVLVRERRDRVRHGRGEEQGLALAGQELHDALQGVDEAEVEHLVGLVQNQDLDIAQGERAAVDEVEQAARGGDEDVDAGAELALLLADGHAAVDHGGAQAQVAAVGAKAVGDLARTARGSG